tara:strand:+ start:52 stop:1209 length:1158 start_codon:yes stop_codon:yes gene_type:complete
MKNRKVYRPGGMPTYRAGGKTYSTKKYKKNPRKAEDGFMNFLSSFMSNPLVDMGSDLLGYGLQYAATQQQQQALQDALANVQNPSQVIGEFDDNLVNILTPDPSATIQDRISQVEGRGTDVEIDTTALDDQRGAQEQTTANVLANLSRSGTKGTAGLSQVLDAQNKSDLGLTTQALNIEAQEAQLEEAAKKAKEADITALSTALGGQEFQADKAMSDIYKQELESTADLETAIMIAQLQNVGAGSTMLGNILTSKDGSIVPKYEEGGQNEEVMEEGGENKDMMEAGQPEVSPGEEEHSTNPIDLVRDGEKIGEMTGGEVIMPSKDVEVLEKLLSNQNADGVMELMATLMTKWTKEAMEHQEKQIGGTKNAKGGMRMYKPTGKINY